MTTSDALLVIQGATVIDAVSDQPAEKQTIWVENGRISRIGASQDLPTPPPHSSVIDATGKYVIPGLMNANAHLCFGLSVERLVRHFASYDHLIVEAAQVALQGGQTTIFDTWGPRRFLMRVRDEINKRQVVGARIFCAGNIIGFDGPLSDDFLGQGKALVSADLSRRINAIWTENVGRYLMWLTPDAVAAEVRRYIKNGIDFIKYASNEHGTHAAGAFLQFSPRVQRAIVDEAHDAGLTAQAHCMSVEGLRCALDAGCDLITHCNMTGPTRIPEETLDLFVKNDIGAVVFPFTQRRLDWMFDKSVKGAGGSASVHTAFRAADANVRNLIRAGATLLMANDALLVPKEHASNPGWGEDVDNYLNLRDGHFFWFKAMEEKGCSAIEMLRAATRNVAVAYGKGEDLGTLEEGKIADMLVLNANPLLSAENYRTIHLVIKDGSVVDRSHLPVRKVLTSEASGPEPEEASYVTLMSEGKVPLWPPCFCGKECAGYSGVSEFSVRQPVPGLRRRSRKKHMKSRKTKTS